MCIITKSVEYMDFKDKQILSELQSDGRLTNLDLADRINLSPSACHRRVKSLEDTGIIDKYVAIVSPRKIGKTTSVFVQVTLDNQRRETLEEFERAVERVDEVMECYLMGGLADYIMRVLVADPSTYEVLHQDVLTRLPGVQRVVSNFAIRSLFRRTAIKLS